MTGTYATESTFHVGTKRCPLVDGDWSPDFVLASGERWQFENPSCGTLSADGIYTGQGEFVLTLPDGATLFGRSFTSVPTADGGGPIVLTIAGGTRSMEAATGSCTMQNRFVNVEFGHQRHWGTFSCAISSPAGEAEPQPPVTTVPSTESSVPTAAPSSTTAPATTGPSTPSTARTPDTTSQLSTTTVPGVTPTTLINP